MYHNAYTPGSDHVTSVVCLYSRLKVNKPTKGYTRSTWEEWAKNRRTGA